MIIVLGECFENNFFYEIKYITPDISLSNLKLVAKQQVWLKQWVIIDWQYAGMAKKSRYSDKIVIY